MSLHESTFEYLKPTESQMARMANARQLTKTYAETLGQMLPDGPDKTYIMRELRSLAMWVNVAITRQPDGSPRT